VAGNQVEFAVAVYINRDRYGTAAGIVCKNCAGLERSVSVAQAKAVSVGASAGDIEFAIAVKVGNCGILRNVVRGGEYLRLQLRRTDKCSGSRTTVPPDDRSVGKGSAVHR